MDDVFAVLTADHQEVLGLLIQLEEGVSGAGATPAQLELRRQLVERLVTQESGHEAVEEMFFWPAVRERVTGGDQLALHGVGQESAAKPGLNRLNGMNPRDTRFEALLAEAIVAIREHITFEQDTVWTALRPALPPHDATALGMKLRAAKLVAPTRPHPHTPAVPGALKTAGTGAALLDRVRDAASSRRQPLLPPAAGSPAATIDSLERDISATRAELGHTVEVLTERAAEAPRQLQAAASARLRHWRRPALTGLALLLGLRLLRLLRNHNSSKGC